jgi:hypothetical protein
MALAEVECSMESRKNEMVSNEATRIHPKNWQHSSKRREGATHSNTPTILKDVKPGKNADAGTKRKMKEYERAYNIQRTDRSSIFFFAVETSGGLGKEAREICETVSKDVRWI